MEKVSELAKRIAEEIIQRSTIKHYRIVLNEERQPNVTDSKIGGKPYWPTNQEYPEQLEVPVARVVQVIFK